MRNAGLDLLRLLAVSLAIIRHLEVPPKSNDFLKLLHNGGWVGVDIFFVLSGYLISTLLFREYKQTNKIAVKNFLIRRAFKIYPPFIVLLLTTLVIYFLQGSRPSYRQLLGEITFLQNYLGSLYNHTWSLAVEEHFYLTFALIILILLRRKTSHPFAYIPLIYVIITGICQSLRVLNWYTNQTYSYYTHHFYTHLRLDSLMFGVLLGYYCIFHNLENILTRIPSTLLFVVGILLLLPAFLFPIESTPWLSNFGFIFLYAGSGFLLLAALRIKDVSRFPLTFMAFLGSTSYSIYLWHMYSIYLAHKTTSLTEAPFNYVIYYFLSFVYAFSIGSLMHFAVERPIINIRNRFFPCPKSSTINT